MCVFDFFPQNAGSQQCFRFLFVFSTFWIIRRVFFQILSLFYVNTVSLVDPFSKLGHLVHRHKRLMQVPKLEAQGIKIGFRSFKTLQLVFRFDGLCFELVLI